MIQQLKSYLKFKTQCQNEHGIHSPFVFNLVTQCFYDTTNYFEYEDLKQYRKALLENHNFINVTDFGAGSRVFKSNKRKISAIAKNAGVSEKNAKLLFRLVRYFKSENILEIGTSLGLATSALALGNPKAKIITLEGCLNTQTIAMKMFQVQSFKYKRNEIKFINTEFSRYLKNFSTPLEITENFQLIYFDGNHSKKATLDYFNLLLPTVSNETIWIFDDIHWSKEMEQAWKIIKEHEQVTLTIDTFQWGIVFFRKEQQKEHFIINPKRNFSSHLFQKIKI